MNVYTYVCVHGCRRMVYNWVCASTCVCVFICVSVCVYVLESAYLCVYVYGITCVHECVLSYCWPIVVAAAVVAVD